MTAPAHTSQLVAEIFSEARGSLAVVCVEQDPVQPAVITLDVFDGVWQPGHAEQLAAALLEAVAVAKDTRS